MRTVGDCGGEVCVQREAKQRRVVVIDVGDDGGYVDGGFSGER